MLKHIRLNRGLDIPIKGNAELRIEKTIISDVISVKPTDFKGLIPKLIVREGDAVKAGTVIFTDKYRPEVVFVSPCSGTVESIIRGEKRKLLEIRIKADRVTDYIAFGTKDIFKTNKEELIKHLLDSGLWAAIKQRPYGTIANPMDEPKAIFISGFNSAPLAADNNFILKDEISSMQAGIDVLNKFTKGGIFIGLNSKDYAASPLYKLKNVTHYGFDGPHPSGNVGIQIHHIAPLGKGETVWTVDPVFVAAIGKLFTKGIYDITKLVAVTGPRLEKPCYVKCLPGMQISDIDFLVSKEEVEVYGQEVDVRYISGDVLTGVNVGHSGSLGFYNNQITIISEGNYYELLGWAKIIRSKKFSLSHSYFSWLIPSKKYKVDTNLNGGQRAFVVTGLYEKVLPMDIYPVYLLKAILAEDIDKMEQLGIYEVIEEDLALCEYVCPSKIDVQNIVSKGINIMIKEMA
ncbi:MAG: Na(+)-translocating NADH-quinone reductase subunit A [Bacteroidales bacterium]